MARPKKHNAEYFSHDKDMRNDPRIKAVRRKFSHLGYAVWNYILETLSDSDFFEYEWSDVNIEILSGDYNVTPEELRDVVDYCVAIGLLQLDTSESGIKLRCNKLVERFSDLLTKRAKSAKNRVSATETPEKDQKTEFLPQKPQETDISVTEIPQSKVKYSKVDISKDIISSLSLTREDEIENLEDPVDSSAPPYSPPVALPPPWNPQHNLPLGPRQDFQQRDMVDCRLHVDVLHGRYIAKGFPQAEMMMRVDPSHCKSHDDVWRWLDRFVTELKAKGDELKTMQDFQSHFVNWLKLQKNEQQQRTSGVGTSHLSRYGSTEESEQSIMQDMQRLGALSSTKVQ